MDISFETSRGVVPADMIPDDWIFALRDRALVERLNGTAAALDAAIPSGVAVIPDGERAGLHALLTEWLPQLNPDLPGVSAVLVGCTQLRDALEP